MRRVYTQFLPLVAAALLINTQPAEAAELQPFNHTGYYTVSWSGLTVGGLVIDAEETADSYRMHLETRSRGLAKTLSKHDSVNTIHGLRKQGEYVPQRFETVFKLRGRTRHIVVEYDEKGHLLKEENTPPEPEWKRPPVPDELKKDVIDILTTIFMQRQKVYEVLQKGEDRFTIRMYDGRRLTDLEYVVQGRSDTGWNMQNVPVIRFSFRRVPVAGYKDNELEDLAAKKDPSISLYLSDDERMIPLKIVVDSKAGDFYANFKSRCPSLDDCLKRF